jgi:adenine-specific DNA-methyltransferase
MKYRSLLVEKEVGVGKGTGERYDQIELPDGACRPLTVEEKHNPNLLKPLLTQGARLYQYTALISESSSNSTTFEVEFQGEKFFRTNWKTNRDGFEKLTCSSRIVIGEQTLRYVRYFDDFPATPIANYWDDTGVADKIYVVQTSTRVIERCMLMTTDPGDLCSIPLVAAAPRLTWRSSGAGAGSRLTQAASPSRSRVHASWLPASRTTPWPIRPKAPSSKWNWLVVAT